MAVALRRTRFSLVSTAVVLSGVLLAGAGCNSGSPASPDSTPGAFNFAGSHAVTMTADVACADLPAAARTRTYSASAVLSPNPLPNLPDGGMPYMVQMSGATFQPNPSWVEYAYGTFPVAVMGGTLTFPLLTYDGRPGLVEITSSHTYVAFSGNATASPAPGASTVSATFDGWIEFCARKSPMSDADDGYPGCAVDVRADPTPSQPVTYARCSSANHRIVFTRRAASQADTAAGSTTNGFSSALGP